MSAIGVALAVGGIIAVLLARVFRVGDKPVTTPEARKHHANLDGTYRQGRTLR